MRWPRAASCPCANVVAYGVSDVAQHAMALLLELCRHASLHSSISSGWLKYRWCYCDRRCTWKVLPWASSALQLHWPPHGQAGPPCTAPSVLATAHPGSALLRPLCLCHAGAPALRLGRCFAALPAHRNAPHHQCQNAFHAQGRNTAQHFARAAGGRQPPQKR